MLTLISPAKTLDYETPATTETFSQPTQLAQSRKLIRRLRELSEGDLSKLMSISGKLAEVNQQRFKQWKTPFKPENARQAVFAFKGDVYIGLDAYSLDEPGLEFAQEHLRILSGLYGVLRPLDLMQPYRLEMGTRLDTDAGNNLYQFWDKRITDSLNKELRETGSKTVVNLASNEYFKVVQPNRLKSDIITPNFRELRNGEHKFISFSAKKARGLMSRYIIDHRIDQPEGLKDFDYEGYRFAPKLSEGNDWIFTRKPQ